uniref:Uncharacterized protein n=1 Tax=Rhizophora mucronata TaxID=61149 RepID=A0A2P2LVG1_RHIMU
MVESVQKISIMNIYQFIHFPAAVALKIGRFSLTVIC